MSLIAKLPNLEGAKIIVIDEGDEVNYAESLITAWLETWKKTKPERSIDLFLFSGPKSASKIYRNCKNDKEMNIHDCYSLVLEKPDPLENKNPWEMADVNYLKHNSVVIIDSLSSLLINKGLSSTCKLIDKLSSRVYQIVCIYQRDFTPKKIPSINTFGTSYVRLEPTKSLKTEQNLLTYKVSITHSKPGGGILQQIEIVEQNIESHEIRVEKFAHKFCQKTLIAAEKTDAKEKKIQASFRIEMNDREMEQRNATPLPYTLSLSESKIHYEPDETDDLDEEDPDDDLDF